ncbi:YqhA family protein [Methylocella sp.]|uniref:YqhA family protein n=1 Tax=Methylocella sp. TaxID=1978226 RepID=UPI003783D540
MTSAQRQRNPVQRGIERLFFGSRWLMAPFLAGLVLGLVALLYKFGVKLWGFVASLGSASQSDVLVGILSLVDFSLTANLILIVICSTFENFVRPINLADHPEWPDGLVQIGFAGLKQKLISSIVAITAVNVLERLLRLDGDFNPTELAWVVGCLVAFAVVMVLLALADRIAAQAKH